MYSKHPFQQLIGQWQDRIKSRELAKLTEVARRAHQMMLADHIQQLTAAIAEAFDRPAASQPAKATIVVDDERHPGATMAVEPAASSAEPVAPVSVPPASVPPDAERRRMEFKRPEPGSGIGVVELRHPDVPPGKKFTLRWVSETGGIPYQGMPIKVDMDCAQSFTLHQISIAGQPQLLEVEGGLPCLFLIDGTSFGEDTHLRFNAGDPIELIFQNTSSATRSFSGKFLYWRPLSHQDIPFSREPIIVAPGMMVTVHTVSAHHSELFPGRPLVVQPDVAQSFFLCNLRVAEKEQLELLKPMNSQAFLPNSAPLNATFDPVPAGGAVSAIFRNMNRKTLNLSGAFRFLAIG
jgi:hypothetical protein